MGNKVSSDVDILANNQYETSNLVNMEGLGEFMSGKDLVTNENFLILITRYSISNKDMAESEIVSLERLKSIKNASTLLQYQIKKDQMLCFDNYSITMIFNDYPVTLEKLIKNDKPPEEQDIWIIIGDLLDYIFDINSFGIYNGDLQPKYIQFNKSKIVKVLSPLLYTSYQNAYKYRLANESYKSTFSPELLA